MWKMLRELAAARGFSLQDAGVGPDEQVREVRAVRWCAGGGSGSSSRRRWTVEEEGANEGLLGLAAKR